MALWSAANSKSILTGGVEDYIIGRNRLLSKWSEIMKATKEGWTKKGHTAEEYYNWAIMAKSTNWAMKSENAVTAFYTNFNNATMVISESAHLMYSYTWPEIKSKANLIRSLVLEHNKKGNEDNNNIIWRENWAIMEYAIWHNEYSSDADQEAQKKARGSPDVKHLRDPLAYLHRCLYLKELNYLSEGAILYSPGYWQSKAWNKRDRGLNNNWKGVYGFREEEWQLSKPDIQFSADMRHMTSVVQLATVEGILRMYY